MLSAAPHRAVEFTDASLGNLFHFLLMIHMFYQPELRFEDHGPATTPLDPPPANPLKLVQFCVGILTSPNPPPPPHPPAPPQVAS
eukprot:3166192-Rhodomonas_salina.1